MPEMPLTGRIAVVTGASAGIGEAVVRMLAANGAATVINARRSERLEALIRDLGTDKVVAVAGDAAEDSVVREMLDVGRHAFGASQREADLVVVNAGRGLRGGVYDSDPAQWEEVFRINLLAASRFMRAAAERMAGPVPMERAPLSPPPTPSRPPADWLQRPRDIVVLGSCVGRHISPFSSLYGSAKAGVHMLTESLRRVMAPGGVRVTLLEPGIVRSEFQDGAGYDPASFGALMDSMAPVLTPADIARLVLFVVSQPAGVHVCDVMIRPTRQEYP